jgi:thiamine kinase-like enzyme
LDGIEIPCGITHGDFTPPNTRVDKDRLFLFDWEYASWEAPILWDVFHFHIKTGKAYNEIKENGLPIGPSTAFWASFVLYLLHSVCHLLDEGAPGMEANIDYRRRILVDELSKRPAEA